MACRDSHCVIVHVFGRVRPLLAANYVDFILLVNVYFSLLFYLFVNLFCYIEDICSLPLRDFILFPS